ncbi:MAG: hypothetical protein AB1714_24990 [Acidobacteriota bacterium]
MNGKRSSSGGSRILWAGAFLAGILALGLPAAVHAQDTMIPRPGTRVIDPLYLESRTKGMYYAGSSWMLLNLFPENTIQVAQHVDYDWVKDKSITLPATAIGGLGGCVYNGLIYGFYVDIAGYLWCFTVDPASWTIAPITIIAYQPGNDGCAAVVCGDSLWVFTNRGFFTSSDGQNFTFAGSRWWWEGSSGPAQILDAITFYPLEGPAQIMIVYQNANEPSDLVATIFDPGTQAAASQPAPLPFTSPFGQLLVPQLTSGQLLLGTFGGFAWPAGEKAPCVQFYGQAYDFNTNIGSQGRWEYNLVDKRWSFNDITKPSNGWLQVTPVFAHHDAETGAMQMMHLLNFENYGCFSVDSDWMVPQNYDSAPNGYGWAGLPTPTQNAISDSDTDKQLRSLWTLVGIVLGPPPFALNGASDASGISSVVYATDSSTTITSTETVSKSVSVASNNQIKAGFGKLSLDLSYAHGWTSSNGASQTVDVQTQYTFGPQDETPPAQGVHGWAIFYAPVVVSQWYKLYAYDKTTYLNQDLYATSVGDAKTHVAYFSLANPSDGSIPGLFDGFPLYPASTDLASWKQIQNWNAGGSDWDVIFGDQSNPSVESLDQGTTTSVAYTESDTSTQSTGNSNSFSTSAGASFNLFGGFSSGVTVGYDADYSTSTEVDSTISKGITCTLAMPIPENPGDVTGLEVQPYWLMAKSTDAPWIPPDYSGNLPWCLTWNVTGYGTLGGTTAGLASGPRSASGTIYHGTDKKKDTYTLTGGRLRWRDSDGLETPLPLTADQFDPSKGATVEIGGHAFPADGSQGNWVRKGDTWTYRTRDGVKRDPFTLLLDFANQTWSFDGSSKNLDQEILTADGEVRIELEVEGTYRFSTWLKHDVDTEWSHTEKKAGRQPYRVHGVDGAYNSATGAGHVKLRGRIPETVDSFGDVEIRINGSGVRIPLLSLDGFLDDLHRGREVNYESHGLSFEIDFQTGKWKATIERAHFRSDMAPKKGAMRVQVLVGGRSFSDQTFQLKKHRTDLSYSR